MKSFRNKIGKHLIITLSIITLCYNATAQVKFGVDTLQCHMMSFSAGLLAPSSGQNSLGLTGGNMSDLYSSPYLDFSIEWSYKYPNGWMFDLVGDLWFGMSDDNLQDREVRMGNVFTDGGLAMSWGGYDGQVTAYNRAMSLRPGIGKVIRLIPKNPNSGLLLMLNGGWFTQKTIFTQEFTQSPVPQLAGDYGKLYDHQRHGMMFTESIGFLYMSNYITYVNLKVTFEVSQCFSWSTRPYQIDNLMGLNGKDNSRYFDLLYGIRLTWIFPFTGKTTYDYYYY